MTGRLAWTWPWVVAVATDGLYLLILELPVARDFYELTPLPGSTIGLLVLAGAAWTVTVQLLREPVGRLEEGLWRLGQRVVTMGRG